VHAMEIRRLIDSLSASPDPLTLSLPPRNRYFGQEYSSPRLRTSRLAVPGRNLVSAHSISLPPVFLKHFSAARYLLDNTVLR
jgi:hypothetical protein